MTLTELLLVALAAALLLGWGLGWHFGYANGAHDGRMGERERWLERNRRAAMRRPYDGPPIASKTGPNPFAFKVVIPAEKRRPPATTGELAAVADAWIEKMRADEAAWRQAEGLSA